MERQANSMQSHCRAGCGFYGSPATEGLCSVCFKEALKKKQQQPNNVSDTRASLPLNTADKNEPKTSGEAGASGDSENSENRKNPKKRNRCSTCLKKIGFTGFECRCGGVYCGIHRYTDEHDCTFDYRALGAQEIRKNNPVVAGEKIKKI